MKGSLPKISIVTPSYNQGQFLERTILSVLNQEYPNLEYIIIDGNSSDNSLDIIEKYKHRLTYWESEQDNGFGHAINKGFVKATGSILAWLNSDDVLLPGCLSIIGNYFQKHMHVGLVFGDRYVLDGKDNLLYRRRYYAYFSNQFKYGKTLPQEATFWRKETFMKAGGYLDENLKFAIDFDLWCRVSKVAVIKYVPHYLGAYRIQPAAKSSTILSTGHEERKMIIKKYFQRYPTALELQLFQLYVGAVRRIYKIFGRSDK